MPGYKPLPISFTGPAADQARRAESRRRGGDPEAAARLLEDALEASARRDDALPGWLCGRLAALYRTLERYDDEVALLERYRDSQTLEDARVRYDARLSKARTIAERKRPRDCGAISSVRRVIERPHPRAEVIAPLASQPFSSATMFAIASAANGCSSQREPLRRAIERLCAEARRDDIPVEDVIGALRATFHRAGAPDHAAYDSALLTALSLYFDSAEPD